MTRAVAYTLAYLALAMLLAFALGGCATTTADCTDLARGICKVSGTRFLTDSGISLRTPQGLTLDFTSKPDQAGTQAAINALAGVITVLVPAKPVASPIVTPGAGFGREQPADRSPAP